MTEPFILYNYFRSSASYRVRIALHHKKIPFEYKAVHLVKDGGEQFLDKFKCLNPLSQVPCLVHNGQPISQSMAILQYLEDICPDPTLFSHDPHDRAVIIQICETINSGIQPLQNLAVLNQLEKHFQATPESKNKWIAHWNHIGFTALECLLKKTAGDFCFGDTVTAADCFLVPQVFSAKRFNVDLSDYPTVLQVNEHAKELEAFQLADPTHQPDYSP